MDIFYVLGTKESVRRPFLDLTSLPFSYLRFSSANSSNAKVGQKVDVGTYLKYFSSIVYVLLEPFHTAKIER